MRWKIAALAALALGSARPAAAAVTIKDIGDVTYGFYSIPTTTLLSGNTYDFTFTLDPTDAPGTLIWLLVRDSIRQHFSRVAEPVTISLYQGTPTVTDPLAGTLVETDGPRLGALFAERWLRAPGAYYLSVGPSDIAVNGETLSGVLSTPEPAAWALMVFGLGAVGWALRRRTTATVPA